MTPLQILSINSITKQTRIEILINHLIKKLPLQLKNGNKAYPTNNEKLIKTLSSLQNDTENLLAYLKREKPKINCMVNNERCDITLAKLQKSAVFGGLTKGTNGGYRQTVNVETLHSDLLNIALQKNKQLNADDIQHDIDVTWKHSIITVSNQLPQLFTNSNLRSYIDGDIISHILSTFARVKQNKFKNRNKWNPADIWLIDYTIIQTIHNTLNNISNLTELNLIVDYYIKKEQLIPISLKKVIGEQISLKWYNLPSHEAAICTNIIFPKQSEKSKTRKIQYTVDDECFILEFRTFNKLNNIMASVRDEHAYQGKIGFNSVNKIFNMYNAQQIPHFKNLVKDKKIKLDDKQISQMQGNIALEALGNCDEKTIVNIITDIHNTSCGISELSCGFLKVY